MSYDTYDLANDVSALLTQAGYVIYCGNAETGETCEPNRFMPGGCIHEDDWWFTWTQPGCDIETGDACSSELGAVVEALSHFFSNATIGRHHAIPTANQCTSST